MSLRVFVLTCSNRGTAAAVLPDLVKASGVEFAGIILNRSIPTSSERRRLIWRKVVKTTRIGPFGALNGVRMRRWYQEASIALRSTSVDEFAASNDIPLLWIDSLKAPELRSRLRDWRCDLGLSLGNGYIPKSVFSIAPMGMLNVHHEILPDYRGAQSVLWPLYEGSATTGFTIHRIDAGIDTGPIVSVERMPIQFRETLRATVVATYAELIRKSGIALARILQDPALIKSATVQSGGRHYTTPSALQFLRIQRNHDRLRMQLHSRAR